ncbi:MAG: hypothetical protein K9K39_03470 [Desulfohalobiaceae bacterium]|nr:hypothetical protein [Desulfohalobiaceae bacterium]
MERKKVQLGIIVFALLIAFFMAWYMFKQSNKFNSYREKGQEEEKQEASRSPSEENESENIQERLGLASADNASASANATNRSGAGPRERAGTGEQRTGVPEGRQIMTRAFVQDLTAFVVSKYHPGWELDNPGDQGRLRLDFNTLNARYGTELTGLRYSSRTLEKARQEILDHLLDQETLEGVYSRYNDDFVRALVQRAEKSTRPVQGPDGDVRHRALAAEDVAEMLQLGSSYLRDVSAVLTVLGEKTGLYSLVRNYLQAKEQVVHLNYRLNQMKEEYTGAQGQGSEGGEVSRELREKRERFVQRYSRAIAEREELRTELVSKVREGTGRQMDLGSVEILYIAEWVHRRLPDGGTRSAIVTAGNLFRDMADRLNSRAQAMRAD